MNVPEESLKHLDRIATALEGILALVEKGGAEEPPKTEVAVNDSMGSCPECESTEVKQQGRYPAAIYQCDKCQHMWVNEPDAFFKS